jgi:DNA-binding NarL/FixJ family response regulator
MTPEVPLRVLVVDDHELFRTGLRALLEEEGVVGADSPSGEAALAALPVFQPHVVVMDLNMPGMSGIEAAARVLEAIPGTAVLMLTINRDDARIVDAVRAGAAGYLLKDAEIGHRLFLSPSTVKHHGTRLLSKLGVDNRLQAVAFAIRHGLSERDGGSG